VAWFPNKAVSPPCRHAEAFERRAGRTFDAWVNEPHDLRDLRTPAQPSEQVEHSPRPVTPNMRPSGSQTDSLSWDIPSWFKAASNWRAVMAALRTDMVRAFRCRVLRGALPGHVELRQHVKFLMLDFSPTPSPT
jgi:hypothetical protein